MGLRRFSELCPCRQYGPIRVRIKLLALRHLGGKGRAFLLRCAAEKLTRMVNIAHLFSVRTNGLSLKPSERLQPKRLGRRTDWSLQKKALDTAARTDNLKMSFGFLKHFLLNGGRFDRSGTLAEIAAVIVALTGLLAELRKWRR
jgi:hypothetical protein